MAQKKRAPTLGEDEERELWRLKKGSRVRGFGGQPSLTLANESGSNANQLRRLRWQELRSFGRARERFGLFRAGTSLAPYRRSPEVTMVVLKRAQRAMIADKLADAANLAIAAMVFGQVLTDRFSTVVALIGLAVGACLMTWGAVVAGGAEE